MSDSLTVEKALEFVEDLLLRQSGRRLSEDETAIFRGSWEGLTYNEIQGKFNIYTHIVDIRKAGGQLWNTIAKLFKLPPDEVTKKTFPGLVEQQWKLRQQTPPPLIESPESESSQPDGLTSEGFVGREQAVADLDELRAAGATCILIQSPGGVGKTVLAERYLSQRFQKQIVRFDIGKETENISSAEGLIEQKLRDLGEEPGREFMVSCDRLRSKLQAEALPVLVDNLEPALDENGRLIETHRSYVELFRVLSDPSSKSLTLITSRERVCENLNIRLYRLSHLSLEAWQEYFVQTHLDSDTPVTAEIHQAYRGNALAMKVLRERITLDYSGQIEEYWESNQTEDGVSVETDVENLIFEQFERLAMVDVNAYHLLCRMGCFRYQDVPAVPRDGLLCLLWELPPKRKLKVIEALCGHALVERVDGEYKLHPLIREEAVERLRNSEDWEISNRMAAEFWTNSVKTIDFLDSALKAIESYWHYLYMNDYYSSALVLCHKRRNQWDNQEELIYSFTRLGLLEFARKLMSLILNKVKEKTILAYINHCAGDLYWMLGDISKSIQFHKNSGKLSSYCDEAERLMLASSSIFNQGLCYLDIHEFSLARESFKQLSEFKTSTRNSISEKYSFNSDICLLLLESKLSDKNKSIILNKCKILEYKHQALSKNNEIAVLDSWSRGYNLVFLAEIYKNLNQFGESLCIGQRAIEYSEESGYEQVKAKALTQIAAIYRIQQKPKTSITHNLESINILEKINAKCDLAEAYYQLALTYQAMDDRPNSQLYFQKALTLWERIDAPKQIQRVRQSMEAGRSSESGGSFVEM